MTGRGTVVTDNDVVVEERGSRQISAMVEVIYMVPNAGKFRSVPLKRCPAMQRLEIIAMCVQYIVAMHARMRSNYESDCMKEHLREHYPNSPYHWLDETTGYATQHTTNVY